MTTLQATLLIFAVLPMAVYGQAKQPQEVVAVITTRFGEIKVKLYNETPLHRDNFIKLVKEGYYDGTLFHRIIQGFMIQGGDPESKNAEPGVPLGNGGPGYNVPAEFNARLFHKRGALAAARMGDNVNPKKESSGSQFYIVQGRKYAEKDLLSIAKRMNHTFTAEQAAAYAADGGTPQLDGSYTVFGEVVSGLEVIDVIAAQQKDSGDRPVEDIAMTIKIVAK